MVAEFEFLERLLAPLRDMAAEVGVGDDAAVVDVGSTRAVIATDALVEGVHFDLAFSGWADVGWKAMAVNVSDLSAMGAVGRAAVVALAAGPELDESAAHDLYNGLRDAAMRWGIALVGGDTVRAGQSMIAVTIVGELLGDSPILRSGARPGDEVAVVGRIGLAAAALALHRAGETDLLTSRPELSLAHRRPEPPHPGPVVEASATSAIDVSDGLGQDLGHVARRSGVRVRIDEASLPTAAGVIAAADALDIPILDLLLGGDDYSLAVTGLDIADELLDAGASDVHRIGMVEAGEGVHLIGADGVPRDVSNAGWQHDLG